VINNPEAALDSLLLQDGISRFQKEFLVEHGIYLTFDDAAQSEIATISKEGKRKALEICAELFSDYFHGIRLMKLENFTIPAEAVKNPKEYLDNYIKQNYKK